MRKMLYVAQREFVATAATKAFIFAVLISPAIIGVLIYLMPRMMARGAPNVEGEIAILDATGQVADGVQEYLQPQRMAERRRDAVARMNDALPSALRTTTPAAGVAVDQAVAKALGEVPKLHIVTLGANEDLEAAKRRLADATAAPESGRLERLALVVVHPDAAVRAEGRQAFGTYDLFVRNKLDDRIEDEVKDALRDAIIAARIRLSGFDRATIDSLTRVERVTSKTVTAAGEGDTNEVLNMLMPMAFMGLLLVGVMMSGQYLLTTTVEEKSTRVVEVLLAAVSPMQLMVGKILGQLAVGLVVLALYFGLGLLALVSFASIGLLDPVLIVFLLVFFLLSYASVGAIMAAIGASVNEMREAQGMMTPVMIIVMIPWFIWMPISRDPNSMMAIVLSFIPPLSNFVMMLRMASATPPPIWQPLLAVVVGALGAYASLWFSAKIFRIGLLMYGKPPDMRTLIKWVRMA